METQTVVLRKRARRPSAPILGADVRQGSEAGRASARLLRGQLPDRLSFASVVGYESPTTRHFLSNGASFVT
jgi:hypothetical protein